MMKIAICDDNKIQLETLDEILKAYSSSHTPMEVTTFSSGEELIDYIRKDGFFDIYILDVMMPGYNGMEVAITLRQMNDTGKIIFLTASMEYAVASYDVDTSYYMLKPVNVEKLFKVLDRIVAEAPAETEESPILLISTKTGTVRIELNDLMYVDLQNRCMAYHMKDGKEYFSHSLRGSFRDVIDPVLKEKPFISAGISLVVNLNYIESFENDAICLIDGTRLYPPRSSYIGLCREWKEFVLRS